MARSVREYIGYAREETLLERLEELLSKVNVHNFKIESLEPHMKDGGVFVKYSYNAAEEESAIDEILSNLRKSVHASGGVPSWIGLSYGQIWRVKGSPWREVSFHFISIKTPLKKYPKDMNRPVSGIVKVSFDGPDLSEEALYRLMSVRITDSASLSLSLISPQPYGRIYDITPPTPVPAGSLRTALVSFHNLRSATSARNTVHGLRVPTSTSGTTILRTSYASPVAAHVIRDYITSHPRIFLPVLFFLIGTVTYAVSTNGRQLTGGLSRLVGFRPHSSCNG